MTTVESWIAQVNASLGADAIPYYSTINDEPDVTDDLWMTVAYDNFGSTKETYCEEFVEDGAVRLVFLTRRGTGYNDILEAAERFADAFYEMSDPAGRAVLTSKNSPDPFDSDQYAWYVVEISIDYELR